MEADQMLQRIRQRGYKICAVGNDISLSPKNRIDEKFINFVVKNQDALLAALLREKQEVCLKQIASKKLSLNKGRCEVLKILLRRFLNNPSCRAMVNFRCRLPINDKVIEDYLDLELRNFNFDLEAIIDMYRHYTPPANIDSITCTICGYNPPFCACNKANPQLVNCGRCKHLTPDEIGSGASIGTCALGKKATEGPRGKMLALFRDADRYCDDFEQCTS